MRRAAKRDANERGIIEALEEAGATVTQISQDGVFDLLVGWKGRFAMLEVKAKTGKLQPKQKDFIKLHRGCPMFVVRTEAQALGALGEL